MSFPARLHVLLASAAPVGVILRRGPAKSVCSILWDRRKDRFELGQWLRGRIYELRSDVSPDGRHMIYFAMNGRWHSETRGTWTAISRVPWLKAVTLFGKGDAWQGGGLFTSASCYWLNGDHFRIREEAGLQQDLAFRPVGGQGAECLGIYYPRLLRDGWLMKDRIDAGVTDRCTIFEKTLGQGWILRKYSHAEGARRDAGKAVYWDEHELENPKRGLRHTFPKWEWADVDRRALAFATGGCLFRARLHAKEMGEPELLFDANEMKFERREAPY